LSRELDIALRMIGSSVLDVGQNVQNERRRRSPVVASERVEPTVIRAQIATYYYFHRSGVFQAFFFVNEGLLSFVA